MDKLIYLVYPALLFVILWKVKLTEKGKFNEDYMSLSQSKSIQAICIILIMLHHMSQKVSHKYMVKPLYLKHGLEPFTEIGYLLVGVFFFYSGYGLYKSYKEKEDYLKGFYLNRLTVILLEHVIVTAVFAVIIVKTGIPFSIDSPFTKNGPSTVNPYSWYIYALIICYILFHLSFRWYKNDNVSIGIIIAGVILYILFCNHFMYGGWWYNTILAFPAGILYSKKETGIHEKITAHYKRYLILTVVLTIVMFYAGEIVQMFEYEIEKSISYPQGQMIIAIIRSVAAVLFAFSFVVISMKVRIGNRILDFTGKITLEIYLVHGIFVQMFSYEFLQGSGKRIQYISNPLVYVTVVFILTFITAFILNAATRPVYKRIRGRK